MTSAKVKFRASKVADREGTIFFQIIHERKVRQLATDYRILPSEWDGRRQAVAAPQPGERQELVAAVRRDIRHDLDRFARIIRRFDAEGISYTADDVADEFTRLCRDYSLFSHMNSLIDKLKLNGHMRTAETYTAALRSFKLFRHGTNIMLDSITSETMEAYEAWLRRRGTTANTISFYMRIIRAAYNRAVDAGAIDDRHPFRHVYTGVDKTVKRALPLDVVKQIKTLDLRQAPTLDYARDMFMMSFYLRGMSFVDMAFLRKTDLSGGHIAYRRHKTGQLLIIAWTHEMQSIVDKYPVNKTAYLLPIIKRTGIDERAAYRNASYNINRCLRQIAQMLDLPLTLTMYVARHSWASAAKAKGIPLAVISEGMGHDSEATTRIYLASLDTSAVDRANAIIIDSLQ